MTEKSQAADTSVWWKNGYVWMVLGGPLLVVVASVVTFFIAVRNPDPALDTGYKAAKSSRSAGDVTAEDAMAPALLGRNHAATGSAISEKNKRVQ